MQVLATFASLLAASAATPIEAAAAELASRQAAPAAKCADWGEGFGGSLLLGPTDAQASRCCIYGESIALCCRNDPALAQDPFWSRSLECSNPYWANTTIWGYLYSCNTDPGHYCKPECDGVPYLYDNPKNCPK
ncbi:hypothetical protein PG988_007846 [Apiospora saccharicola]